MDASLDKILIAVFSALTLAVTAFAYLYWRSRSDYSRAWKSLIAFSQVEVDFSRVTTVDELRPAMDKVLQRLASLAHADRAILFVLHPYRKVLPSVQRGFPDGFLDTLESEVGAAMGSLLTRETPLPGEVPQAVELSMDDLSIMEDARLTRLADIFHAAGQHRVTVMGLETRDRQLGVLLLPSHEPLSLETPQKELLSGFAMQLGAIMEKYTLLHEAERRSKEFALLTEIGRAVSSRLDPDEVLKAIHEELRQLFDTSTFYVAFQDEEKVRFEFETEEGVRLPKRERALTYGFTEHIVRTGQPLIIESDLENVRDRLGVVRIIRPAKCFCGAPILMAGKVVGVMAAMDYEKEFVFNQHDLELMQIAARQVAVSMENALLFAKEQKRARYLAFLNNISRTAISSQTTEEMMAGIIKEIQENFHFDHIGIGIVDYNTKEIEIKAEAGRTAKALGKRVPLGVGIMGRVARVGEMALEQGTGDHLLGIIPESRSVLCIPITYTDSLLGILNIESQRENAFAQEEVLLLQTLADLLATALHNVMVYQKMEQQSITDPLTGIKTRRYFTEALLSEFKRGTRSGRPFCVVLIDLDKFKEVNDTMGHLEGDLVLARIGRLMDQKVRQSNVVARYGGDEFIILMPETGAEQACILSERLRLWIATDPFLNERHITGSFGVAEFPLHGATAEDIIRVADNGMYISKRAGGNKVSSVEPSPENLAHGEQRQIIASYLSSFLRREHVPTEDEIISALRKINSALPESIAASALRDALRTITSAVEMREMHASGHGDAVASYAEAIARELQLSAKDMGDLVFAAKVHDVGKIVIPEKILNKAGSLTYEEFQLMKHHTVAGAHILEALPDCDKVRNYVLYHQERYDGGGYPEGLKGEESPLCARIIAVAEAYVNMISERPYADSKSVNAAMTELEAGAGTQFDGMLVRILLKQLKGDKAAVAKQ